MKKNGIDNYINSFPEDIQLILQQIRNTIKQAAPEARETIKYAMPTFELNGNLVHFAAFSHHIGFYPVPSGIEAFKEELSAYKMGKGSIQFPLDKPMPLDLISRIVQFRVKENSAKASKKKTIASLAAPVQRALENNGISTLQQLSKFTEKEVLGFHGMGKSSIPKLREALAEQGLSFKDDK